MLIKATASLLSPAGRQGRLSILTYHRVLARTDPLLPDEPDVQRFEEELTWLTRWFQVLPLDEAVHRLVKGTLPARAAAVTFDDGYANNVRVALPILLKHKLPATFFIATDFLNGGQMWNDTVIETIRHCRESILNLESLNLGSHTLSDHAQKRAAIDKVLDKIKYLEPQQRLIKIQQIQEVAKVAPAEALMMRDDEVATLHQSGMQIGAHTCTHPILTSVPDASALQEITQSKRVLEDITNSKVVLFAYPNGHPDRDYVLKHAAMAKTAGFEAAVTTAAGAAKQGYDMFQLPRFTPWDRQAFRYGMRMVANLRTQTALATH